MGNVMYNGGRLGPLRMNTLTLGQINITDSYETVEEILKYNYYPDSDLKIVDAEVEASLPLEHPNVIGGGILLPPIEALIAEQDGDETLYNMIYSKYFQEEAMIKFVQVIIAALMVRVNILIYMPNPEGLVGPQKFMQIFTHMYGIEIGIYGQTIPLYSTDPNMIKVWLNLAYDCSAITPREYLYFYPGYPDKPLLITKLMYDLNLIDSKPIETINQLSVQLKECPNLIMPIARAY